MFSITWLYQIFRKTGIFSWLIVNFGQWFGKDARRQLLIWCRVITPEVQKFLNGLEKRAAELPRVHTVDYLEYLTSEEFYRKYALIGKPVAIANIVKSSELAYWSFDSLKQNFGQLRLWVRQGQDYDTLKLHQMSLQDYIDSMLSGSQEEYYMGNNPLPKEMYNAVNTPTQFAGANTFEHQQAQLWIGGQSTGAHLHRDLCDNFILLLNGSKTLYLAPPDDSDCLYVWEVRPGLNSSKFNIKNPDYKRFPLARKARFVIVTLKAGELLYIPCGWFHQVINNEPSCSINFFGKQLVANALQEQFDCTLASSV